MIKEALEESWSIKKATKAISRAQFMLPFLKSENKNKTYERDDIIKVARDFCKKLYSVPNEEHGGPSLYRVTKKCFRQKFWNFIKKYFLLKNFYNHRLCWTCLPQSPDTNSVVRSYSETRVCMYFHLCCVSVWNVRLWRVGGKMAVHEDSQTTEGTKDTPAN